MALHRRHPCSEKIGDRQMVERTVSIYVLRDVDGEPKYVGQTTNITRRLWHHWRKNRNPDPDKGLDAWIASLSTKPVIDVLEVAPYAIRFAIEREWTIALREAGHMLLNVAIGSSIAPETAVKMGDAKRGRTLTEEHKAKIGASLRGDRAAQMPEKHPRVLSPEHREKLLESARGHTVSDQTRMQIAEKLRGHPVSEETRKKIGEASRRAAARKRIERQGRSDSTE